MITHDFDNNNKFIIIIIDKTKHNNIFVHCGDNRIKYILINL